MASLGLIMLVMLNSSSSTVSFSLNEFYHFSFTVFWGTYRSIIFQFWFVTAQKYKQESLKPTYKTLKN